jgi:hypothetical protein
MEAETPPRSAHLTASADTTLDEVRSRRGRDFRRSAPTFHDHKMITDCMPQDDISGYSTDLRSEKAQLIGTGSSSPTRNNTSLGCMTRKRSGVRLPHGPHTESPWSGLCLVPAPRPEGDTEAEMSANRQPSESAQVKSEGFDRLSRLFHMPDVLNPRCPF